MKNKNHLLHLDQISYSYDDSDFQLKDISLTIQRGEKIAVLGSNGAGKSTFFLVCNGVLHPNSGNLFFKNDIIDYKSKKSLFRLRQAVGIVFQDPNQQIIGSTVEQEVSFGPVNLKLPRDEIENRVSGAIKAMNLTQYREKPPHYLSGGEKKRVTIADILAMESEIILFDEPTASLDPQGISNLEEVLYSLTAEEKAIMISTHDIDFAWRWADRVLLMCGGSLEADLTPLELFSREDLLRKAGLRRPYLYDASLYLHKTGAWAGDRWAKTPADLAD